MIFCGLLTIIYGGISAMMLQNDSTKKFNWFKASGKPSTQNDTWFINSEPEKHHGIDTTIFNLEEYNGIQRPGIEYTNAGNMGTAAFPLVFEHQKRVGFNLGYNQFDVYRILKDSIRYYQVVRPYTELRLLLGLQNEQMMDGRFANQHKHLIYYGVHFMRYYSKGIYENQRANDNAVNVYAIFRSPNKRLHLKTDLIFNSFKSRENGGATISVFDSSLFQKILVPVALRKAENLYRQIDFYLNTGYSIGKKYKVRDTDSTYTTELMPVFTISYQLNVESNKIKYRDYAPDSAYYQQFYNIKDSVANDWNVLKTDNAIQLDIVWRKLQSDTTYLEKNLVAHAEAGFEHYQIQHNLLPTSTQNLYVSGYVRSNNASKSNIIYYAAAKTYFYGWNQGDLLLSAQAGYYFKKWGIVTGNFAYTQTEMPYQYEQYTSHPVQWSFELPKTRILSGGGKYQNTKWGIVAEANYYRTQNLPVYAGSAKPQAGFETSNFVVIHAGNKNGIKGFHCDNDVWFTQPLDDSSSNILDLYARVFTRHSLYYERRVFKKALWFSVGVDLRFRYQNNPPYYEPYLATFYPSFNNTRLIPQLDFFVNAKIKTVRAFLKVDNLISAITQKGYYALHRYAAQDLSFRAGINWRFFE